MNERAALKGVNEGQTASLETALLHGRCGQVCGTRCEPLSTAPFPIERTRAGMTRKAQNEMGA